LHPISVAAPAHPCRRYFAMNASSRSTGKHAFLSWYRVRDAASSLDVGCRCTLQACAPAGFSNCSAPEVRRMGQESSSLASSALSLRPATEGEGARNAAASAQLRAVPRPTPGFDPAPHPLSYGSNRAPRHLRRPPVERPLGCGPAGRAREVPRPCSPPARP
jgi:hypothetical protein